MNQTQTATPVYVMKKVKFILCNFVPVSIAALFASTAFAESCPNPSVISKNYTAQVSAGKYSFVKDAGNGASDTNWKLTSWPSDAVPDDLKSKTLTLSTLTTTPMNPADPWDPEIKDLSCNYTYDQGGKTFQYSLSIAVRAKLTSIAYVLEKPVLTLPLLWEYNPVDNSSFCPSVINKGTIEDCGFETNNDVQINGYWDDARWRCGSYVLCSAERRNMDTLADTTNKNGCTNLTCSKEIDQMNGYVQEIARQQDWGVSDGWWTCWSTDSQRHKKANPKGNAWRIETSDAKWGTLHGTRVWEDKHNEKSRKVACYGDKDSKETPAPSGFWPNLKKIGVGS